MLVRTKTWLQGRAPAFLLAARRTWSVVNWAGFADVVALLFLGALVLYFFRGALLEQRVFFENDTAVFYYPLSERFDQALRDGEFPVWVRSIFAGFPLFADSETGMLNPIKLLMHVWLTPWQVLVWGTITLFLIAAWSMYAFGRAMGLRPFAAAISASVFALGSFLVAQVHHANVIRSAVWLPFVFFAVEMALRSTGRCRLQWMVIGGLGAGMQSLGVHVQVVLMTLLALGFYLGWRWFWGPVRVHLASLPGGAHVSFGRRLLLANANVWSALMQRTVIMVGAGGLVALLGLGLGAVQLLPLYELAQFSNRADGVEYSFAATYSMPTIGVLQTLTPYLFRATSGEWWTQWAAWEFALYVGLPTLLFVAIGALFARNRYTFFFLGLLAASLLTALGPNAPVNLHQFLWELPGFSFLRAPGRFTLLVVFSAAVLAGWGAHWLDLRLKSSLPSREGARGRAVPVWRSAFFSVFLALCALTPGALAIGAFWGRSWLDVNLADVFLALGKDGLVAGTGQAAIDRAVGGLRRALDFTNPGLAVSVGLLQASVLALMLWYGAPRLGYLCKGALLAFLCFDLLLFGASYHPTISPLELGAPSGAAAFLMDNAMGDRTLLKGGVRSLEPNRLLPYSVPTLGGYSSLAPQRNLEYIRPMQMGYDTVSDSLVDAASVRYLVTSAKFPGFPSYKYSSFDPRWPLTQGLAANRDTKATFDAERARGDTLAVVATLTHGVDIAQDTALAELTVVTTTGQRRPVILRAGREVSEWAYEREDVKPRMRHQQIEKAFTSSEKDSNGRAYAANYYYAELPLGALVDAQSIEYRYTHTSGNLQIFSLTLVNRPTGAFTILRNKTKYRVVYKDQEAIIHENTSPMPRAYLVGQGTFVEPGNHILARMIQGGFDPRQTVLLEDPEASRTSPPSLYGRELEGGRPSPPSLYGREPEGGLRAMVSETPNVLPPPRPFFKPARFAVDEPSVSTIEFNAPSAGYLVVADSYYPGWHAYLDGEPVPVYRANYLFRAIQAPAGPHTVEFRFESATLQAGLEATVFCLVFAFGVLAGAELWALVKLLSRWAARLRPVWVPVTTAAGARMRELTARRMQQIGRATRPPDPSPNLGRFGVVWEDSSGRQGGSGMGTGDKHVLSPVEGPPRYDGAG